MAPLTQSSALDGIFFAVADFIDVVVHVFSREARVYYAIEKTPGVILPRLCGVILYGGFAPC